RAVGLLLRSQKCVIPASSPATNPAGLYALEPSSVSQALRTRPSKRLRPCVLGERISNSRSAHWGQYTTTGFSSSSIRQAIQPAAYSHTAWHSSQRSIILPTAFPLSFPRKPSASDFAERRSDVGKLI